ncbi:MAG: DNA-3-methyladenine glycosylase 2 family protein [Betaproteobacteria bacterium]|nr:DNA-3-methyladenine glycosylase 2 family protein [Betaproteobacteria bacterium]
MSVASCGVAASSTYSTAADVASALDHLCAGHPPLRRLLACHGYPPFWRRTPGFATLVLIILEQQVSLASAHAVYPRVRAQLGEVTPDAVTQAGAAALGLAGVTRPKQRAVLALAEACRCGALDLAALDRLPDDAVADALTALPGVGPWTANVYLLMVLCRTDVWPVHDVALHEALRRALGAAQRPGAHEALNWAEGCRPHRAAAARLLYHARLRDTGRTMSA